MSVFEFQSILQALVQHGVEFIVVGGISAALQGAPIATFDLDAIRQRSGS